MTGVEWLPGLPTDWDVSRLSYLCRIGTGELDTIDADPEGSLPFYIRSPRIQRATSATGSGEAVLTPGDGAVGEVFHHHRAGNFAAHQRVYVLDRFDRTKLVPRFFYWYFSSRFRMVTSGGTAKSTVESLRRPMFTSFPVVLPPLAEQRRIADYLDRETATIDALIEKQRALVAALRRRRVAAIVTATSGLQAEGSRRDSASSWLKDVPAHWSDLPIKRVLTDVQSGYWGSDEGSDGIDVRVVRVADFDRPTLSVGTAPTIRSVAPTERDKAALRRGDLLMEKSGGTGINPVGFVVSYESDEESIFANFIVRLRPRPDQHARFWLYAFNGAYTSGLTWKSVNQTTGIQNLDMTSFLSEVFPVPPPAEQREIADHLDRETAKIDALIAKAERFIQLAQERRAALITAAVTGQIEIPTED